MGRRLARNLIILLCVAALGGLSGCAALPDAVRGGDPCVRAMALQPVDAGWLAQPTPYEEVYRTMVEARSPQLRREIEAITTCYQPGDEIWVWRRPVWLPVDQNEFVAGEESGYALVRNGTAVGGVAVGQQQTGSRVR